MAAGITRIFGGVPQSGIRGAVYLGALHPLYGKRTRFGRSIGRQVSKSGVTSGRAGRNAPLSFLRTGAAANTGQQPGTGRGTRT